MTIAKLFPQRIGHHRPPPQEGAGASVRRIRNADFDQLLRIFHRQRPKAHRIQQLENRRVRADAERQRQDRDDGESGTEAKEARAILEIAPRAVEQGNRIHLIDVLADQGDVAEFAPCGVACVTRRHAARDVVVDFNREVRVELARALVVPACAAEKPDGHGSCRAAALAPSPPGPYSSRSASVGSRRDARSAGR